MDVVDRRGLLGSHRLATLIRWQAGAAQRSHALATKFLDLARTQVRKAVSPGGITGVIVALALVVATDLFLLFRRSLRAVPPVSLTFMIVVCMAVHRCGALEALVTRI